jgi:hypothetical protein
MLPKRGLCGNFQLIPHSLPLSLSPYLISSFSSTVPFSMTLTHPYIEFGASSCRWPAGRLERGREGGKEGSELCVDL